MTDNKREQEREELHKAIWGIANDLRGAIDGWDFKIYVLGTMFYRYLSENLTAYANNLVESSTGVSFDYTKMSDEEAENGRETFIDEKGFFLLPSELFCNVTARAPSDENLNVTLDTVFRHIEETSRGTSSEDAFKEILVDFNVNNINLGPTVTARNKRLVNLLNGVASMKLGAIEDQNNDSFGDAYEYLMGMYAANAGKSGGEYFTPAEVSVLLTKLGTVGKKEISKVYDPACGSGSLLLKAKQVLGKDAVRNGFYGQEKQPTIYKLCKMNMFLHNIPYDKFSIVHEDTLINPGNGEEQPFDLIVSNPPYSIKWEGKSNPLLINDPRFSPAGVLAPEGKADFAFIMHSLSWLAPNGTACIVCFPGIMYRGGAEQKIRKYLVDNNYIDCIIQMPSNLFYGTSIATCIMVMKKNKQDSNILFIDASAECVKVTNNNKLTDENIEHIVDFFTKRENIEHISSLVSQAKVAEKEYNLSVSTYVEADNKKEEIDIGKLNAEIEEIVAKEQILRDEIDKIIAELEGGDLV